MGIFRHTSPNNLKILKLRLLILRVGEPGKQLRQFPKEVTRSRRTCAIVIDGSRLVECGKRGSGL